MSILSPLKIQKQQQIQSFQKNIFPSSLPLIWYPPPLPIFNVRSISQAPYLPLFVLLLHIPYFNLLTYIYLSFSFPFTLISSPCSYFLPKMKSAHTFRPLKKLSRTVFLKICAFNKTRTWSRGVAGARRCQLYQAYRGQPSAGTGASGISAQAPCICGCLVLSYLI